MININNGVVKIENNLVLSSKYSFDEFKRSNYYNNQSEERIIQLGAIQNNESNNIYTSLFFQEGNLKQIFLMLDDPNIQSIDDEPKRKLIHDNYLASIGLKETNKLSWGEIISDFDERSFICHIIISYY
jgi:hypothetical protein